jgi:hypothetical protein
MCTQMTNFSRASSRGLLVLSAIFLRSSKNRSGGCTSLLAVTDSAEFGLAPSELVCSIQYSNPGLAPFNGLPQEQI